MRRIFNLISIFTFALLLFLTGCEDAKNSAIDNRVYLANVTNVNAQSITVGDSGSNIAVQVRMAKLATQDTKVNLSVDENVLKTYNELHSTNYTLLPANFFSLESGFVTIKEGLEAAEPVYVKMKALTPELNKTGLTYAVPVAISSVEGGNVSVLSPSSYFIFVVTPVPYADVPVLKKANGMKMTLKNQSVTVTDFTVEFLVKIDNLGLNKPNQILFNAADFAPSAGGSNGEIFTRFSADGAAGKWDKFQIKNQGKSYDAQTSFKNNVWYHIACVNDNKAGTMSIYVNGILDSKFPNAQVSTTVNSSSPRGFRFCGESDNDKYMRSNVQASEIRFWTVARTESQIKNNMYSVSPASLGLYAYWKLNEASGNTLKDATENGNDAVIFGAAAAWLPNQKVEVGQ